MGSEMCNKRQSYHSMLTKEQSDQLENLQKRVIKIIFGYNSNYDDILAIRSIPRLKERREKMFEKFAMKNSEIPDLKKNGFLLRKIQITIPVLPCYMKNTRLTLRGC